MSLDLNKLSNKLDEALSNETSETLTKFLNDKRMSNNKQSSVEWVIGEIIKHQVTFYGASSMPLRIIEQGKAMHKSEIIWAHGIKMKGVNNHKCVSGEQYYNETFGGNNG